MRKIDHYEIAQLRATFGTDDQTSREHRVSALSDDDLTVAAQLLGDASKSSPGEVLRLVEQELHARGLVVPTTA